MADYHEMSPLVAVGEKGKIHMSLVKAFVWSIHFSPWSLGVIPLRFLCCLANLGQDLEEQSPISEMASW